MTQLLRKQMNDLTERVSEATIPTALIFLSKLQAGHHCLRAGDRPGKAVNNEADVVKIYILGMRKMMA
jgi:hypothetical protein